MIKLPVFKKQCLYYNVCNNCVSLRAGILEIWFPNINECINCKNFPVAVLPAPHTY